MDSRSERKFAGRLIYKVLTGQTCVREAIKLFPDTKDPSITCAYHALVHYEADEDIRYQDIEYREAQDDYLEYLAQTLSEGKILPKNIIDEYKPYYSGIAKPWHEGFQNSIKEFLRFINIQ